MLTAIRAERTRRATERVRRRALSEALRDASATRARCRRLVDFVREAWANIPGLDAEDRAYVHGWHIELICAHLEAITSGRLLELGLENRLLINIPPGMMKSLLVSVFWPAWEWAYGFAHYQYVATSYRQEFCRRDTRRMRDLVMSEWYQGLYGRDWTEKAGRKSLARRGVELIARGDDRISNTAGGWREGIPWESLTGARGDRVIIDDPQSNKTGESEAFQERDERTMRESVPKRVNDPVRSAIVVVQQRVAPLDTSGVIAKYALPYVKIILPMRFDPARRCATPIGRDPREAESELLFPQRAPVETVTRDEAGMTQYAIDSQHQQDPSQRDGVLFKRAWFARRVPAAPAGVRRARGWDLAGSVKKTAKRTAGVRMSLWPDGKVCVEHAARARWTPAEVYANVKSMALKDDALNPGRRVRISVPQDPGQAGMAQVAAFATLLRAHDVRFSPESGEKTDRALPLSAQAEVGNLVILQTGNPAEDAWIEPYIDEMVKFSKSAEYTDFGDASSRAYAALLDMPAPQDDPLFVAQVGR